MPGARVCICPSEGAAALSLLVSERERPGCHRQVMEMVRGWKGALGTHASAGVAHSSGWLEQLLNASRLSFCFFH